MPASIEALPERLGAAAVPPALEAEKTRFHARNVHRCGYLSVTVEPDESGDQLVVAVHFTLDEARRWHRLEAQLPAWALAGGDALATPLIEAAFAQLDMGIGAARIARMFAPLAVAQRMAERRAR